MGLYAGAVPFKTEAECRSIIKSLREEYDYKVKVEVDQRKRMVIYHSFQRDNERKAV